MSAGRKSPAKAKPASKRSANSALPHRPDLDGLKALAVLAVLGFDAFPKALPGGYLGIDLFFVISGYLIGDSLFKNLDAHPFNLAEFYSRRIRRILPSLLCVLIASVIVGHFLLLTNDFIALLKYVAIGAGFVANWVDTGAGTNPLSNLWPLGIGAQIYLVLPVFLVGLHRFTTRPRLPTALALLFAASFAAYLGVALTDPPGDLHSPLTRGWELLAGVLLAGVAKPSARRGAKDRDFLSALSMAGFAAFLAGLFGLDGNRAFSGAWLLVPVLSGVAMIAGGSGAWLNHSLLRLRAMTWLGALSYPLYLWHWPLLVFARLANSETAALSPEISAGILAGSLFLSWLTHRFIETRNGRPLLLLGLTAILGGAAFVLHARPEILPLNDRDRYLLYFDDADGAYTKSHHILEHSRGECVSMKNDIPSYCLTKANPVPTVLLWGDFSVQQYFYGFNQAWGSSVNLLQIGYNPFAPEKIRELQPDVVVISPADPYDADQMRKIAATVKALGVPNVIFIGPPPVWQPALFQVIARHYWPTPPNRLREHLDLNAVLKDHAARDELAKSPRTECITSR